LLVAGVGNPLENWALVVLVCVTGGPVVGSAGCWESISRRNDQASGGKREMSSEENQPRRRGRPPKRLDADGSSVARLGIEVRGRRERLELTQEELLSNVVDEMA
jgi:hypothetical protein